MIDEEVKKYEVTYWRTKKVEILESCYADDMAIIATDEKTLNRSTEICRKSLEKINMRISLEKRKATCIDISY